MVVVVVDVVDIEVVDAGGVIVLVGVVVVVIGLVNVVGVTVQV